MNAKQNFKKILYIDLSTFEYEYKIHEDLHFFLGGIGVATKLLEDNFESDPIIIATGPLSGYFPYVSKAVIIYLSNGKVFDKYGGGNIAGKMNLLSLDGIVLTGKPKSAIKINVFQKEISFETMVDESFYAKSPDFQISGKGAFSLNYFGFGETGNLFNKVEHNIGISIEGSESFDINDFYGYDKIYSEALENYKRLTVEPRNNPSCFGCPIGCDNSALGEDDENVAILPRCLVSCAYAEQIYREIPFVYSCLSSLGLTYKHEDLENIPELVGKTKMKINDLLNRQLEAK